jgi:hypothetical protein
VATEWSTFRENIRKTLLKDENTLKWDDVDLDVYAAWALNTTLVAHTARTRLESWDADGSTTIFQLPDDLFMNPELGGMVYLTLNSSNTYLDPIGYSNGEDRSATDGYWVWPEDMLNLVTAPKSGVTIYLRYFGYYDEPDSTDDDSTLDCPKWAESAVGYLIAAHALSRYATGSANISQWKAAPDRGTPEDNALRVQSDYYFKLADMELSRHPRQVKENFFRNP